MLAEQREAALALGGIVPEVVELAGVALEVEQLADRGSRCIQLGTLPS